MAKAKTKTVPKSRVRVAKTTRATPAKTRRASKVPKAKEEADSAFFLKLVLYLILGSLWIKVGDGQTFQVPFPIGLLVALLFTAHEHFQIDRKIEYAVLLVAMFVGFWLPLSLTIVY